MSEHADHFRDVCRQWWKRCGSGDGDLQIMLTYGELESDEALVFPDEDGQQLGNRQPKVIDYRLRSLKDSEGRSYEGTSDGQVGGLCGDAEPKGTGCQTVAASTEG